jgi:hypothetical protein
MRHCDAIGCDPATTRQLAAGKIVLGLMPRKA